MAKPTPAPSLSAEEWKLLKKDLAPDTAREIGDLLIEYDPSTFDGFSRICSRFGVLIAQMKIHPAIAAAATRYFEMSFTSNLVAADKHLPANGGGDTSILTLINVARETSKRLEDKSPIRLIESGDDDES